MIPWEFHGKFRIENVDVDLFFSWRLPHGHGTLIVKAWNSPLLMRFELTSTVLMHDMHVPSGIKVFSLPTGKSPALSSVNQLFLWAMACSSQTVKLPEGILFAMPFNQIPNTGWCIVLPNKLDLKNPSKISPGAFVIGTYFNKQLNIIFQVYQIYQVYHHNDVWLKMIKTY